VCILNVYRRYLLIFVTARILSHKCVKADWYVQELLSVAT